MDREMKAIFALTDKKKKVIFALTYVTNFIGTPYIWGGGSGQGFDCSGLVHEFLSCVGLQPKVRKSSAGLYKHFSSYEKDIPYSGSLLFFGKDKDNIKHVAISIDGEYMVEAGGGGKKTTTPEIAHKMRAFVRVRPIASRNNLVAIVNPFEQLEAN